MQVTRYNCVLSLDTNDSSIKYQWHETKNFNFQQKQTITLNKQSESTWSCCSFDMFMPINRFRCMHSVWRDFVLKQIAFIDLTPNVFDFLTFDIQTPSLVPSRIPKLFEIFSELQCKQNEEKKKTFRQPSENSRWNDKIETVCGSHRQRNMNCDCNFQDELYMESILWMTALAANEIWNNSKNDWMYYYYARH